MSEVLALAAAVCFALGSVLQQKGALETEATERDPRFLVQILRRPVWVLGAVSQASGWVLQAAALDRGSLVGVQAISSLNLVIALPLGVRFTAQRVGRREILGAFLTLGGVVVFLSAGQPQGGTSSAEAAKWWTACLVTLVLVGTLAAVGSRLNGAGRALMFGSAAGLGYGLQAAVTKTFVTVLGGGLGAVLGTWSTYVLIASALTGFALQQSALKTGVLAPAIASSNSLSLFSGIVLGVTVYGETLSKSGTAHSASAFIGIAIAIAGVALLGSATAPDDGRSEPNVRSAPGGAELDAPSA